MRDVKLIMYDENFLRSSCYENLAIVSKYSLAQSTPIKTTSKALTNFEENTQISQKSYDIPGRYFDN